MKALAPIGGAVIQLGAAVAVAYFGFHSGLRKTREERGFDRRIAWYEEALTATDAVRDAIIRAAAAQRTQADLRAAVGTSEAPAGRAPTTLATAAAWRDAQTQTAALLRVLGRAVTHAEVESEAAAVTAVVKFRSFFVWFSDDVSVHMNAGSVAEHPFHVTRDGKYSNLLVSVLEELRTIDRAVVAGARAALGYPRRLAELVPNADGVIELPNLDTLRRQRARKWWYRK